MIIRKCPMLSQLYKICVLLHNSPSLAILLLLLLSLCDTKFIVSYYMILSHKFVCVLCRINDDLLSHVFNALNIMVGNYQGIQRHFGGNGGSFFLFSSVCHTHQKPWILQFSSFTMPTLQRKSLTSCRWSPEFGGFLGLYERAVPGSWITFPYSGCSTTVPPQRCF